jgi:hypothetical protein
MEYPSSVSYLVWPFISTLFFAVGEFMSKKFALQPKFIFVVYILILYSAGVLAWLPEILAKYQLSIVGAAIFNEKLNAIGIAGIITAYISIFLLSLAMIN